MHKHRIFVLALLLSLQTILLLSAQGVAQAAPAPAQTRKTSEPYTGDLSIFDSPGRDQRLQINRVMDTLGIAPGKTVADIGAGSGWFTMLAARRVGAAGVVYAVDINPEAIRTIDDRAKKEELHNVKTVLSTPDDPALPDGAVDAVLMLKTYHEIAQPVTLLRKLRSSLRAGAKVGVIDRNGNGENHGVGREVVIREAAQAGYRVLEQYDFVKADKMDYFLVFIAKE
ncbi:MAG: class I SAM-dependent methyltransferase [Candidatus Sulfotelmatobacter sp.]